MMALLDGAFLMAALLDDVMALLDGAS